MKIQKLIVRFTVKLSSIFQIFCFQIFALGFIFKIPQNRIDIVVIATLFIGLFIIMGLNSIEDAVYEELWPEKTSSDDIFRIMRGKSLWFAAFIASCTFAFLSSLSVNVIKSGRQVWVNGKRVYDFRLINPATDRVRDRGPEK